MEAHAAHTHRPAERPRLYAGISAKTLMRAGAVAGMAGGMMMAMWQMVVGAHHVLDSG
jgi:hypothetical protein